MSKAGMRILQGAREAAEFAAGRVSEGFVVHAPAAVDVKAIRQRMGHSQTSFAARYGFSIGRLRDWEQGRSPIDTPSRILLTVIDREPEAVDRALTTARAR